MTRILQTLVTATCVSFALSAVAIAAEPANFTGDWATSDNTFNTMHFTQTGDHAKGPYDFKNGRADGDVSDGTLTGFWAQSGSSQKCESQKLDSYFWGKLELRLQADGTFTGVWGYCEDKPTKEFTGKRVKHHKR